MRCQKKKVKCGCNLHQSFKNTDFIVTLKGAYLIKLVYKKHYLTCKEI